MNSNSAYADDANGNVQDDLRQQVSAIVLERVDVVTADTVAIFPYSGAEALDAEYCHKLGRLLAELLALVIRDGRIDLLGGFVQELHRVVFELALSATPTSPLPTPEPEPEPDQARPVLASSGLDDSSGTRPVLPLASATGADALGARVGAASSSASSLVAATRSATPRNATFSVESAITARM